MRQRRNLIRVLPLSEGALFISTYYWALVLKQARKQIEVKILHTADDNIKEEKKQEEEIVVACYENLDLDSGASK
jgi:hypothetical protein